MRVGRYVGNLFCFLQVTTSALERPPSSDYMFGYSYTGFLSIQKAVDEYILSSALGERMYLNVSMSLFPEKVRDPPCAVSRASSYRYCHANDSDTEVMITDGLFFSYFTLILTSCCEHMRDSDNQSRVRRDNVKAS